MVTEKRFPHSLEPKENLTEPPTFPTIASWKPHQHPGPRCYCWSCRHRQRRRRRRVHPNRTPLLLLFLFDTNGDGEFGLFVKHAVDDGLDDGFDLGNDCFWITIGSSISFYRCLSWDCPRLLLGGLFGVEFADGEILVAVELDGGCVWVG